MTVAELIEKLEQIENKDLIVLDTGYRKIEDVDVHKLMHEEIAFLID